MEHMPEHPIVFNLIFQSSQLGDIYTILLMLDQQGDISQPYYFEREMCQIKKYNYVHP
ncbi:MULTISPECIES: hypothetical protein [Paenibacillus]|uniref:hypothetical protein n=2 Tax=Paenibacillus TaxID=44249 RepID=UPI000AB60B16|nr:hypothetical protein [Paenibacillus odorifer]